MLYCLRFLTLVLIFAIILTGCVTMQYIPPSYDGHTPETSLPLEVAIYFNPYELQKPLIFEKHRFHFYRGDFIEILMGVITIRTTTSACDRLFEKCIEIREPLTNQQIKSSQYENLFAKSIEVQTSTLSSRLDASRENNLNLLLEVSVLEYRHSQEEAMMIMSWRGYEVATSKLVYQEKVQVRLQNDAGRFGLIKFNEAMIKNQEICRKVVVESVEKQVSRLNDQLSKKGFSQ